MPARRADGQEADRWLGSGFPLAILIALVITVWRMTSLVSSPLPLQVDEAQYTGWSHALAPGYYSKPPMIAIAIAVSRAICPVADRPGPVLNEACVRLLQPVAMLVAAIGVGATAIALGMPLAAAGLALLLFITAPFASFYSAFATTDAWLAAWWSLGLLCFVIATRAGHRRWPWVVCGIFVGLGLLTKYSMGVFVISAFVWLWQSRLLRTPGPWLAACAAAVVFLPNLWWNARSGFATISHHADISRAADAADFDPLQRLSSLAEFAAAQFGVFSPIVFAAFLWVGWRFLRGGPAPLPRGVRLALTFAWPMLVIISAQALMSRAFANWALPAAVGIVLVAGWLMAPGRRVLAGVTIAFNLAIGLVVANGPAVIAGTPWGATASSNPFKRLEGWREAALDVRALVADEPGLRVVAIERSLLAAISAYASPEVKRAWAWDPAARDDDHYRRFQNLAMAPDGADTPILLVLVVPRTAESDPTSLPAELAASLALNFAGIRMLPEASAPRSAAVAPGGRPERRIVLLRADGFRRPAPGPAN